MGLIDVVFPEGTKLDDTVPEEERKRYMRFYVGPLERGYGYTIGNSLRRVLLSSIEGCAIVGIKLDGVEHKFSSLDGVKEEISEISLRLKRVRLSIKGKKDYVWATITVDNTKKDTAYYVTSKDITGPVDIQNEEYICELMPGHKFQAHLLVARGRGYITSDIVPRIIPNFPTGVIPIDGIFAPVQKVNFEVRPARVGERTDYDELVLDVWTDGTVSPQDAYVEAIEILEEQFDSLKHFLMRREEERKRKLTEPQRSLLENLKKNIVELNISARAIQGLKNIGVETVEQLVKLTDKELLQIEHFGRRSLKEVKDTLKQMGLRLGMTDEDIEDYIKKG